MTRITHVLSVATLFWLALSAPLAVQAEEYQEAVSQWTSYEDVGNWLRDNFRFDRERQRFIQQRLREHGPSGLVVRAPAGTFSDKRGFCGDAANFALEALNEIDPTYNPQWIFIKNGKGRNNHWVTGFEVDGKLYVMDFGAGEHWAPMMGIHGPYASLREYEAFLASLDLKGFSVSEVRWRPMPGQVD